MADHLLRWNEELRLCGWKGEAVSSRLGELAQLMAHALPGRADRIEQLIQALKVQTCDIDRIEHVGYERRSLPLLYRRLLEAVERHGCVMEEVPLEQVEQAGDLTGCLEHGYAPAGSGELQLIRPQGPISAAEAVAVWLAELDDFSRTFIIGGDEVLDAALHRHGLPVLGNASGTAGDALLQILPLVLAVSWEPQDSKAMQELLSLEDSPVPRTLAKRLVRALMDWPAVGSEDWERATESGLAGIEDEERRRRVAERLEILLGPCAAGNESPITALEDRISALITWMRGRLTGAGDQEDRWIDALQQVTAFQKLYRATGLDSFSRPLLDRLIRCATEQVARRPLREAQAGLEGVPGPGDVVSPVCRIVWWNFTERSAPSVHQMILTPEERTGLEALGVELPDPGVEAELLGEKWRRPLKAASDAVLLVCPKFGADGEVESPHPVWDEITAGLTSAQVSSLVGELPRGVRPTRSVGPLAIPEPRVEWNPGNPELIQVPDRWSPKTLGTLIGNPLYWVLEHQAKLRPGSVKTLPGEALLKGRVAHMILGGLLEGCCGGSLLSPVHAAKEAERCFLVEGPRMTTGYFEAGRERERMCLQRDIVEAARDIFHHLGEMGAVILGVEESVRGTRDGIALAGRLDLKLGTPNLVLDIKWGGAGSRRQELIDGGSLQLVLYAMITDPDAAIGYYIVTGQQLLVCGNGIRSGLSLEGPGPVEVWNGTRRSLEERLEQFRAGQVVDLCAEVEGHERPGKSRLLDGRLELAVNPDYSPYAWLSRKPVSG